MSCMICLHCERNVDTDFDMEGTWTDSGYICTSCTELADAYKEACRMEEEQNRCINSNVNMRKS